MNRLDAGAAEAPRRRRAQARTLPRLLSQVELASYMGRSVTWLQEKRSHLERLGFPKPLPEPLNLWDKEAVDVWIDAMGGQVAESRAASAAWKRASLG